MTNYYQLYLKTYDSTRIEIIKLILLKGFKRTTFAPCSREIHEFLKGYIKLNRPNEKGLNEYYQILKFDIKEYPKTEYLVFEELLIPKFEADLHFDYTIEEIIIEITKFIAHEKALRDYRAFSDIYKMMYELSKLDGYLTMKKFSLLDSNNIYKSSKQPIYEELKLLKEGKSISEKILSKRIKEESETFITLPKYFTTNILNIVIFNYFKFPDNLLSGISNKALYKALSNEIIDPDKTTYLDYVTTLFIDPKYHRSSIIFKSENGLGCLLINELIFNNIDASLRKDFYNYGLLKSKKTDNKDSVTISQSSFSKALQPNKKNSERNMAIVKEILVYFHSIA